MTKDLIDTGIDIEEAPSVSIEWPVQLGSASRKPLINDGGHWVTDSVTPLRSRTIRRTTEPNP